MRWNWMRDTIKTWKTEWQILQKRYTDIIIFSSYLSVITSPYKLMKFDNTTMVWFCGMTHSFLWHMERANRARKCYSLCEEEVHTEFTICSDCIASNYSNYSGRWRQTNESLLTNTWITLSGQRDWDTRLVSWSTLLAVLESVLLSASFISCTWITVLKLVIKRVVSDVHWSAWPLHQLQLWFNYTENNGHSLKGHFMSTSSNSDVFN